MTVDRLSPLLAGRLHAQFTLSSFRFIVFAVRGKCL